MSKFIKIRSCEGITYILNTSRIVFVEPVDENSSEIYFVPVVMEINDFRKYHIRVSYSVNKIWDEFLK